MSSPALYLLIWVYAIQNPSGDVSNREQTMTDRGEVRMSEETCASYKKRLTGRVSVETKDGGKSLYSRFICVMIPPANG